MLADYELRGLLREAAIYVNAAVMAAKTMGREAAAGSETDEGVQTILAFLEKAADDLERATSDQEPRAPHKLLVFPSKGAALKVIEKLPMEDALGFHIMPVGEGRCSLRMWFADARDLRQGCACPRVPGAEGEASKQ
jgi:hypothetical protein